MSAVVPALLLALAPAAASAQTQRDNPPATDLTPAFVTPAFVGPLPAPAVNRVILCPNARYLVSQNTTRLLAVEDLVARAPLIHYAAAPRTVLDTDVSCVNVAALTPETSGARGGARIAIYDLLSARLVTEATTVFAPATIRFVGPRLIALERHSDTGVRELLELREVPSLAIRKLPSFGGAPLQLAAASYDGHDAIIAAGADLHVVEWRDNGPRIRHLFAGMGAFAFAGFAPDGPAFAAARFVPSPGTIQWALESGRRFTVNSSLSMARVAAARIAPDGSHIAAVFDAELAQRAEGHTVSREVRVWQTATGNLVTRAAFRVANGDNALLRFSPRSTTDAPLLFTAVADGAFVAINLANGTVSPTLTVNGAATRASETVTLAGALQDISVVAASRLAASAHADGSVAIWDTATAAASRVLRPFRTPLVDARFVPTLAPWAVLSRDSFAEATATLSIQQIIPALFEVPVPSMQRFLEGLSLAGFTPAPPNSPGPAFVFREAPARVELAPTLGLSPQSTAVTLPVPAGLRAAATTCTATQRGVLWLANGALYDTTTGAQIAAGHEGQLRLTESDARAPVTKLHCSADGTLLAAVAPDAARIISLSRATPPIVIRRPGTHIVAAALAGEAATLRLALVTSRAEAVEPRRRLTPPGNPLNAWRVDRKARLPATEFVVIDPETGRETQRPTLAPGPFVTAVAPAAAASARVVLGLSDGTLAFVDLAQASLLRRSQSVHAGPITAIAATDDGTVLVTGGLDATVAVWR